MMSSPCWNILNVLFLSIPIICGRVVLSFVIRSVLDSFLPHIGVIASNDIYAFMTGFYCILALIEGVKFVMKYLLQNSYVELVKSAFFWVVLGFKLTFLLSLWLGVVPLLIGVLFDLLAIVPLRVAVDESPNIILSQDWAIGLLYLKIWVKWTLIGPQTEWKTKFEQIKQDGIKNVNVIRILTGVIFPICSLLLAHLCIPYFIANGIIPLFSSSLILRGAVNRISYSAIILIVLLWKSFGILKSWLINLHNDLRDEVYLIGKSLNNVDVPQVPATALTTKPDDK